LSGFLALSETNLQEAKEFLSFHTLNIFLSLVVLPVILWMISKIRLDGSKISSGVFLGIAFVSPIGAVFSSTDADPIRAVLRDIHEVAYADRLAYSSLYYWQQVSSFRQERAVWAQRQVNRNPTITSGTPPRLIVLIVGESTTRHHMGIYGYDRDTTPGLAAMRDDLIIADNAKTKTAHTVPSLMRAFCLEDLAKDDLICQGTNLLEVAQNAGYSTTWISNQSSIGLWDNSVAMLAKTADKTQFLQLDASSSKDALNKSSYDEKLLPVFEEQLQMAQQDNKKHLIVVHLMGAHLRYDKRYPAKFDRFHGRSELYKDKSHMNSQLELSVNQYDNAIAYQDSVTSQILLKIKAYPQDALSIYFSDHGDDVAESSSFVGHDDGQLSSAMTDIPFIIYANDQMQQAHPKFKKLCQMHTQDAITLNSLTPMMAIAMGVSPNQMRPAPLTQCLMQVQTPIMVSGN
ncbi:MAG: phosphoethanolamine transferase, partial [Proteobacteria bacterium]|nr:phosphoethanolamine transferase [Pseudomonadota bacterium]